MFIQAISLNTPLSGIAADLRNPQKPDNLLGTEAGKTGCSPCAAAPTVPIESKGGDAMPIVWILIVIAAAVIGLLIVSKVLKTAAQIIIAVVVLLIGALILLRLF